VVGVLGALALITYVLVVVIVGIKLYFKTDSWLKKVERVIPPADSGAVAGYTLIALTLSMIIEIGALYGLRNSPVLLAFGLPLIVGFTEEGSKLLPYLVWKGDVLRRWRLSIKVALAFAIVEAVLYSIFLFLAGNILGVLLRIIVIMFHVSFTAIALWGALRGSALGGYLKASILHAFYDAPVFVLLALGSDFATLFTVLVSTVGIIYTYNTVDWAFRKPCNMAIERIEEKKREAQQFWEERGITEDSLP
jgi:RsiW-degrading membrane proteinase PrsW (M82 family)